MRPDCAACCFYRLVDGKRRLCQLTGARRPIYGGADCHFIPGQWEQLDAILGLKKAEDFGNLDFPKITKRGNRFIIATDDIDDYSVNPISHIAAKAERQSVRPGIREGQVAS